MLESITPNPHTTIFPTNPNEIVVPAEVDLQIIVPCYNVERFVEECVDSILNQKTKYTFHVDLVNDGSKDATLSIINKYRNDSRITIYDIENAGVSEARNIAMKRIVGRYLMFVDSDDSIPNGAIEYLLGQAYRSNADIVQGSFANIKEDGKLKRTNLFNDSIDSKGVQIPTYAWGKVYKSELWSSICFPKGCKLEDWINNTIVFHCAKSVATISENCYNYRCNSKSLVHTHQCQGTVNYIYLLEALLMGAEKLYLFQTKCIFGNGYLRTGLRAMGGCFNNTIWLGDKVRKAMFVVMSDLYNRYLRCLNPETEEERHHAEALKNGNYRQYAEACFLYPIP